MLRYDLLLPFLSENESGGTMHTVNFALEQKRLLACYRHSSKYSDVPQTEGNRILLDEGTAIPVFDKDSLDDLIRRIKG